MPWELDYALLSFIQLQKAKNYINEEDKLFVDVTLNFSSYIINWKKSKISKDFFLKKFEHLKHLLEGFECNFKVYSGDELYGGLNSMIESTDNRMDHYIILNPDIYFGEKSIYYLIESSKLIQNKYFVITQQLPKLWDSSWDEISHTSYSSIEYNKWHEIGVDGVRYFNDIQDNSTNLKPAKHSKWAGWIDIYNKNMWNDFWVYHKDWKGYGACDHYTMVLSQYALNYGIDFQQYILENQLVYPYWANKDLVDLSSYYKETFVLNDIPNQRDQFDLRMNEYLSKGLENLLNLNKK